MFIFICSIIATSLFIILMNKAKQIDDALDSFYGEDKEWEV